MEEEYRNQAAMREDMDGSLGEDGPVGGAGVADRGLFGRRHGSYDGEYASQAGGQGYGGRPPMPYDGGYGDSYGGYEQRRPPAEVGYEGGYGGGAPPVYEQAAAASDLGYGESGVPGGYGDRGHHGHSKKDDDEDELEHERKHKHYAEAAAAAAIGYGLYERHQKNDAEDSLEEHGYDSDGKKKRDSQKFDY